MVLNEDGDELMAFKRSSAIQIDNYLSQRFQCELQYSQNIAQRQPAEIRQRSFDAASLSILFFNFIFPNIAQLITVA